MIGGMEVFICENAGGMRTREAFQANDVKPRCKTEYDDDVDVDDDDSDNDNDNNDDENDNMNFT
jgi:hypothetical protein